MDQETDLIYCKASDTNGTGHSRTCHEKTRLDRDTIALLKYVRCNHTRKKWSILYHPREIQCTKASVSVRTIHDGTDCLEMVSSPS